MPPDANLIARFVATQDQAAFGELVTRYLPLVLASARRRVGDPGLAEDVAQAVFIVLAKKAATLNTHRPIGDWLLTVTKYTAANAIRQRQRRQKHEAAAGRPEGVMDASNDADDRDAWTADLDAAMDRLSSADRQAILLRYYQAADYDAVAAVMGVSEPAARKRVTRAVEKLRTNFARRGVVLPATAIAAALPVALAAAPSPALAATITVGATSATLAGPAVLLSKGTVHAMWMTKVKLAIGAVAATTLVAGAGVGLHAALATAPTTAAATQPAGKPTKLFGEPRLAGWVHVEGFMPDGRVSIDGYYELSSGRSIKQVLIVDRELGGKQPPGPIEFDDPVAGVSGRYFKEVSQYVAGPLETDRMTVPHSERDMADYFGGEFGPGNAFERSDSSAQERVVDLVVDHSQLSADISRSTPKAYELLTDRATGLLRRVHVGPTEAGEKDYDLLKITPVDAPPVDLAQPQTFPLPQGTQFVDNRPTPQVQTVLKQLADIVRDGPGFNAGVLVVRSADPTSGEFSPDLDEVTICAGTPERFFIAKWAIGTARGAYPGEPQRAPRPAGWPTPTFVQTIEAVGNTRPNLFFINDGQNLYVSDSYVNPSDRPPPSGRVRRDANAKNIDPIWNRYSIVGQLWGTFLASGPNVRTRYTSSPAPGDSGPMTLEGKTDAMFSPPDAKPGDKPQLVTISTQRLKFLPDLGPYPLRIEEINRVGQPGDERFTRTMATDFSGAPAWMFREPLRVPDTWRTMFLNESDPSYMRFTRLIPATDNVDVPADWYAYPAVIWPRGK